MCTPPLGPVGASPDDSQAAARASDRVAGRSRRHGSAGILARVSGLRAIRARALLRPRARDRGRDRACRRRGRRVERRRGTTGSAYAVLINVPGAQSSGTLTSPARLLPVPRPRRGARPTPRARRSAAPRAYGAQRAHGRQPARRRRDGRVARRARRTPTAARRRPPARSAARSPTSSSPAPRSRCSPARQFEIPGIGYGAVDERRVVQSDGAYRGSEVALHVHLSVGWHDLPAGTEILLGYAEAAAPASRGGRRWPPRGSSSAPDRDGGGRARRRGLDRPAAARRAGGAAARRATSTPTDTGDGVTPTGIEAPPPGGFTRDPADRSGASRSSWRRRATSSPSPAAPTTATTSATPRADTGFHEGSDLFAPEGTPLVAVQYGMLHNVGWNRLGGWRLWIEDTTGNWFYYAHLSAYSPIAVDGAHVSAGDVVGFVGHTGDAIGTPSHLHFEIHPAGQWAVPPYDYLQAWQGHRNPFAAHPQPSRRPSRRAQLELDRHLLRLRPRHRGGRLGASRAARPSTPAWSALGVPAPTAAELLAAAPRRHDARRPPSTCCAKERAPAYRARQLTHAVYIGARRALGRGHGAAARAARAARARRAAADADRAGRAARRGRHHQAAAAHARRLPARGRRDEPRAAPHGLPLVAVGLRAGLHVLRHRPHGPRPQPRARARSASSCCASRACCATSRTRAISQRRDDGHGRAVPQLRQRARGDPDDQLAGRPSGWARARSRSRRPAGSRASTSSSTEPLQVKLALSLHAPDDELRTQADAGHEALPDRRADGGLPPLPRAHAPPRLRRVPAAGAASTTARSRRASSSTLLRKGGPGAFHVNLIAYNPTGTEYVAADDAARAALPRRARAAAASAPPTASRAAAASTPPADSS